MLVKDKPRDPLGVLIKFHPDLLGSRKQQRAAVAGLTKLERRYFKINKHRIISPKPFIKENV